MLTVQLTGGVDGGTAAALLSTQMHSHLVIIIIVPSQSILKLRYGLLIA